MAYYDYECRKCRKRFTVKQTFEEHDRRGNPKCPKCGSVAVSRRLSEVFVKTSRKS